MSDIVERLRGPAPLHWEAKEAADEITRLRNELHIAQEWSARVIAGHEQDMTEITRLRAEVDAIRKAIPDRFILDPPDGGDVKTVEGVQRMAAEVERFCKSRNRWGQKYNKLLGKHKADRTELANQIQWVKDLADSLIAEEVKTSALRAEVEKLKAALRVYAGPVGGDNFPHWSDGYPGGVMVEWNTIDFGDAARAALEEKQ